MPLPGTPPSEDDAAAVVGLLGRSPRGIYTVAVRDAQGLPVVLANHPLLDDGTPMPTLFWLCGRREVTAVSRLEADGGVSAAEETLGLAVLGKIHDRYALLRESFLPPGHTGPRPSGGVGGTRQGVKCLHAHFAWWLAGGDDAVGAWVAARLAAAGVTHAARAG